jgi:hypothetical protein
MIFIFRGREHLRKSTKHSSSKHSDSRVVVEHGTSSGSVYWVAPTPAHYMLMNVPSHWRRPILFKPLGAQYPHPKASTLERGEKIVLIMVIEPGGPDHPPHVAGSDQIPRRWFRITHVVRRLPYYPTSPSTVKLSTSPSTVKLSTVCLL